jgi:hypothetical protein
MTARFSLLILFAIPYLGCNIAPTPTPKLVFQQVNEGLEFLCPQKIVSLDKTSDGKLVASFTMSARYFSMASDNAKGGTRMLRLANRQLKRAIELRKDLYVTVEKAGAMPRIVRMALSPDPRATD